MGIWMETDHSLSGGRPKSTFVSRGATAFEIFWRGSPPVEPGLGFDSCFSRRIGWSSVLDIVELSVQVNVKTARGLIGRPDFRSGRVLRLSRLLRQVFQGFQDLVNRVGWTGGSLRAECCSEAQDPDASPARVSTLIF